MDKVYIIFKILSTYEGIDSQEVISCYKNKNRAEKDLKTLNDNKNSIKIRYELEYYDIVDFGEC